MRFDVPVDHILIFPDDLERFDDLREVIPDLEFCELLAFHKIGEVLLITVFHDEVNSVVLSFDVQELDNIFVSQL